MDPASIIGILLGIGALVGGNVFEGGKVESILQPTAALIVFGGTFGATLLSFPLKDILNALSSLREVFFDKKTGMDSYIDQFVRYSNLVRRNGLMALDREIPRIENAFLKNAVALAVDRMGPKALRQIMEQENFTYEEEKKRIAKVFETAGGFAPTIGIIGAVLGLIHVMENLSEPSKLGAGIAVAFVATIYGVGSANLILLPISKKLVNKLNYELSLREMMIEGVIGVQTGLNPHFLREKLEVFIENRTGGRKSKERGQAKKM